MQLVVKHPLKHGLINVVCNFHNGLSFQGLPTHPRKLFKALKEDYEEILKDSFTSQELKLLLPSNGETKLEEFPMSLILKLLNTLTPYGNPVGDKLECNENMKKDIAKAISFIRCVNSIDPKDIYNENDFVEKKNEAINILNSLGAINEVKG